MRLMIALVLIWGCLCLFASSEEDELTGPTDTAEPLEITNSSTSDSPDESQQAPKAKVKKILNKVKNKLKIGSGTGGWKYRYRNKSQDSSGSRYDTTTVLWIVFGTIGGGILLMGVYCGFRAYLKNNSVV